MSKAVNSKWKKTFPDTIGNQNRPATGVDDTQPFETGGFPQYMANDPVRYDLQNAAMSQSMSNDARLKEMVDARGKELDDHKVDPGAHKTGIAGNAATATKVVTTAAAGASANIAEATMASNDLARIRVSGETNAGELALETADDGSEPIVARQYTGIYTTPVRTAKILDESGNTSFPGTVVAPKFTGSLNGNSATATKLQTPRTLSLTGKAAGSATFDGSANASINVTSVNADTASKLSTARKINITGNASGSAAFDGTSDVSINVSVSQAAHADKATQDTNGRAFTDTNAYMHISALADNTDFNNVKTTGIYYCTGSTYPNRPHNSWGILTVYSIGTVKQEYRLDNAAVYYTRVYNNTNWTAWSKVNAANADTATKLATPRAISLTGNASGSANFDGSGNVSINATVNESKHAAAANALNSMGNKTAIKDGTREPLNLSLYQVYNNGYPVPYGNLLSIGGAGGGELLAEWSGGDKGIGHLYYRNRRDTGYLWSDWRTVAFTSDINSFAPTKTGAGASGTWGISITGNAAGLSGDLVFPEIKNTNVSRKITWNGSTDGADIYYQTTESDQGNLVLNLRDDANCYLRIAANGAFKSYFSPDGVFHGNVDNADKVDGYHASDLLRTLGGNRTPVITDIFDRAGTIDMTTMSAADKATHKANINKARNATQNIWNTDTGISAYGGDYDMANGYGHGSLKLTQSYKNFDKILVVGANDKGELLIYKLWDVWALANAFAGGSRFQLFHGGDYWFLYGSAKKGTWAGYVLSTDTVWSCQGQNSGIVAIYGIKY